MPYTPILATLGYVFSPDGRRVLMIHRNARPEDAHFGKYNGLGGKLEPGEDVVAGLRREIREEAGIECLAIRLVGFPYCGLAATHRVQPKRPPCRTKSRQNASSKQKS